MSQSSKWLALIVLVLALWSPAPGPTPPEPTPDPAPVVETGFRVLFVYEKDDLELYTPGQRDALSWANKAIDEYTRAKCATAGGGPERRNWDDDQDVSKDTPTMQEMRKAVAGPERPYVVVSNGKTGWKGPMPETSEQILALLKKYGGE